MDLRFRISPGAFFQVNTQAAEVLYGIVGAWCAASERTTVLDICCGTGTIGLSMAKRVRRVIGIELSPDAVGDAVHNAALNRTDGRLARPARTARCVADAHRRRDCQCGVPLRQGRVTCAERHGAIQRRPARRRGDCWHSGPAPRGRPYVPYAIGAGNAAPLLTQAACGGRLVRAPRPAAQMPESLRPCENAGPCVA